MFIYVGQYYLGGDVASDLRFRLKRFHLPYAAVWRPIFMTVLGYASKRRRR